MDEKTAKYFAEGRRRIVSVAPSADYTVVLLFDNGERRVFDCKPFLTEGSLFNKVSAPQDFARAQVDAGGNLFWDIDPAVDSDEHWNNRIDFCRDACYLESVPVIGGAHGQQDDAAEVGGVGNDIG